MSQLLHPVSDQFFWGMMFGVFVVPIIRSVLEWCARPHPDEGRE